MAATVKIKRSSTASSSPTTGDLELGELAVNTHDGKLFYKRDNGTASVLSIPPLGEVDQHIIPKTTEAVDLGSETHRFRELYLSGSTINIGGATISSDGSGSITISANGATLPAGSKVASGGTQQEIATVADTALDSSGVERSLGLNDRAPSISVPFFTKAGGTGSPVATFNFKMNVADARIFKNFTLASGAANASGISLFSF